MRSFQGAGITINKQWIQILKTSEMSTCEENDDLLNIFNLISNIKEDLRKLKSLEIPSDENGIKEIKVYLSRKICCI